MAEDIGEIPRLLGSRRQGTDHRHRVAGRRGGGGGRESDRLAPPSFGGGVELGGGEGDDTPMAIRVGVK